MKYYIDTEFNAPGAGKPIDLISIAVVDEHDREFYRENKDALTLDVSPWIREHVFPHLVLSKSDRDAELISGSPASIADELRIFIGGDQNPQFWGYYCGFDYVVLSQLMGGLEDWPAGWPYLMYDLRQWLDDRGLQRVKQSDDAPHDALQDARWIHDTFMAYQSCDVVVNWNRTPKGRL